MDHMRQQCPSLLKMKIGLVGLDAHTHTSTVISVITQNKCVISSDLFLFYLFLSFSGSSFWEALSFGGWVRIDLGIWKILACCGVVIVIIIWKIW